MASTLLLDRTAWDLCLDTAGNIALASEPYSQAQDIASEARVYSGECYYDTTRGVPYDTQILGQYRPVQILKANLVAAAMLVSGVTSATVFLSELGNRKLGGQIQFESDAGGGVASL